MGWRMEEDVREEEIRKIRLKERESINSLRTQVLINLITMYT